MMLAKIFLLLGLGAAVILLGLSTPAYAANTTLVVKSAIDWLPGTCNSDCTLREAILAANATVGVRETIKFKIPKNSTNCDGNSGVCTIHLLGALPHLTDPVVIDGFTQPGAHPNTLAEGNDAAYRIVIDGTASDKSGLVILGGSSTLRGLVLNNFSADQAHAAIYLDSDSNVIQGNFIGTDVTGTLAQPNNNGIRVYGSHNLIGGKEPAARNLISGNERGIYLLGDHNTMQGNYVGTTRAGTDPLGNTDFGIGIDNGSRNLIGGKQATARNILSGNGRGIRLAASASANKIIGNAIGVTIGRAPLANSHQGIQMFGIPATQLFVRDNLIARNEIAHNDGTGIELGASADDLSYGNTYSKNKIYSNGLKGILNYLTPDVLSDDLDLDEGPNHLQNAPYLSKAKTGAAQTTIKGILHSAKNTTYRIEFFTNEVCDANGYGEGNAFFGSLLVTTGDDGTALFTFVKPKHINPNYLISATATEKVGGKFRSTSQFSNCAAVH